jgi:uncharacterized membrane protein YeaQ/YmgE (transglycosylase-associated protein family)
MMSLLIAMLIGGLVGAMMGFLLRPDPDYIFINVLLGIAGGILGLVIYFFVLLQASTTSLVSIPASLSSALTALFFVIVFNGFQKAMPKPGGRQNPPVHNKKS